MPEKSKKKTASEVAQQPKAGNPPTKKPYNRPVLYVIGKIGKIVSDN